MKKTSRILCLILSLIIFFSVNIIGAEAAPITVARTEKLVADKETASSVELRWRKVSKATGYKVYQVVDGKLKAIKTVKTNKYVVEDLTASETYKFAVKTYRKYQGKTYWSSKYRSVTVTTDKMGKSPTPKATATKNSVTLKWAEVEGATGYRVYQYSPSKDKYVVKASVKGVTTYKLTDLKEDTTYKFKIKPYAKTSKGVVWNKASSAVVIQTVDKTKAKFTEPSIGTKGVTLNWGKVSGATAYRLYRVVDGEYIKEASGIKDTSYKVERLESGATYTFVVRAYKKVDGKVKWYTKSEPLTITTKVSETQTSTEPSSEDSSTTKVTTTKPTTTKATTTKATTTKATTTKATTTKATTTKATTTKATTTKATTTKATTTKATTTKATTTKATTTTKVTTTKATTTKPTTTKPTEHKHTVVVLAAVEATCKKTGLTEGKRCSTCNEVLVAQQTIPKKSHSYTASVTTQPTCKAEGVRTYMCTCGAYYSEKIAKTDHTIVTDSAVEATCSKVGLTEGKHCSVCGTITVAQQTVAKKSHTLVTDYAVSATCTNAGLTEGKHCSKCGTVTVSQSVIPAKNHSDSNSDGKCDACGMSMSGSVPEDPPAEETLTAYRVKKYKEILGNETLYFKISSEYSDGTMVPIEFATKDGNMYMNTTAEGINMKLYYEKSSNKMYAYALGFYYIVPEDEMDDMDMTEMLDTMRIGDVGFISVSKDNFNGKSVICESFVDSKTGYTMKYYFEDETLVGIERTHPKKSDEIIYIETISNSVSDSYFKRPALAIPMPI